MSQRGWHNIRSHGSHCIGTAGRNADSWLVPRGVRDGSHSTTALMRTHRSTLGTKGGSIAKAGRGGRLMQIDPHTDVRHTPGPNAYQGQYSSLNLKSGVSIKGGKKMLDKTRKTNFLHPTRTKDTFDEARPGAAERVTTFGQKKYNGGVIARSGRKTDGWLLKDVDINPNTSLPGARSTLKTKCVTHLGGRSPRFSNQNGIYRQHEITPGPAAYNKDATTRTLSKKGIKFHQAQSKKGPSFGSEHQTWLNRNDETPGPAAYSPMSAVEAKRDRMAESSMNQSKILHARVKGRQSRSQSANNSRYDFQPQARGSQMGYASGSSTTPRDTRSQLILPKSLPTRPRRSGGLTGSSAGYKENSLSRGAVSFTPESASFNAVGSKPGSAMEVDPREIVTHVFPSGPSRSMSTSVQHGTRLQEMKSAPNSNSQGNKRITLGATKAASSHNNVTPTVDHSQALWADGNGMSSFALSPKRHQPLQATVVGAHEIEPTQHPAAQLPATERFNTPLNGQIENGNKFTFVNLLEGWGPRLGSV